MLATSTEENLGGFQFDLRLASHLAKQFDSQLLKATNKKGSIYDSNKALLRLRYAVQEGHTHIEHTDLCVFGLARREAQLAKEALSSSTSVDILIEGLYEGQDLQTTISRAQLGQLCADLVELSTKPIDDALRQAGLRPSDLTSIELFGGATRIPLGTHLVRLGSRDGSFLNVSFLQSKRPCNSLMFHSVNTSTQRKPPLSAQQHTPPC